MLNRIILMGRLTRDPELRHTQSGTAVASFSLAVDRDFKSRDGGKRRSAEVVADNIYFGDSRRDGDGGGSYSRPAAAPAADYGMPPAGGDQFAELTDDDGELPF